jgi:hypothetical protein
MQGGTERRTPESPSSLSKMSDSTYVLGMEELETNRNELSLSNDRHNVGDGNHVSVDSASLRSPVDSTLGDDHHQLLGQLSTTPVIMSPTWGGRPRNFSSKSSSSTRRYSLEHSKCFIKRRRSNCSYVLAV